MNDINRKTRRPEPVAKPTKPATKTIEIKFSLPVVSDHPFVQRLTQPVRRLSPKRKQLLVIAALGLVIVAFGVVAWNREQQLAVRTDTRPQNPLDQLQRGNPDYPTVLPAGKSAKDLGGWTRVSPEDRDPVYAYVDQIDGVPISVSQQPLPASFKENPDSAVRNLAFANNATKTITVSGTTVHLGSSTKGPQSVIFQKGETLILIKASTLLADEKWEKYIQSLS
ncbi:MAG: hypothetical protein V4678_00835 [Patescibacteria group bacterium]